MRPTLHLFGFRAVHTSRHQGVLFMSKTTIQATAVAVFAVLALASVGVVLSSSVAAAKDTMADCAKFADGWKAAYNAKNADALASMYEPKKGTYSNVFWTGTGHDVLAQAFKQELSMGNTMTSIKCETSNAAGDIVVSIGNWSATSTGPDGKPMSIGGHWQSSAEGHDGHYLLVNHTSNMQLPPPK